VATREQRPTAVYVETGRKRVFTCALDWPGWCRSGKDEGQALDALAAYAPRYAIVTAEAGVRFPKSARDSFEVVERLSGSGGTDFGVPSAAATADSEDLTRQQADRLANLVAASWEVFDRVVAGAPASLRKGPRGGGRDRDAIVDHVLGAETAYARMLGVRHREPARGDTAAIAALREAIVDFLRHTRAGVPPKEKGWLPRYAARRIAWHVLDHAWEIEDRSEVA